MALTAGTVLAGPHAAIPAVQAGAIALVIAMAFGFLIPRHTRPGTQVVDGAPEDGGQLATQPLTV